MQGNYAAYRAFIESVCAEFGCSELARPLQEGFSVLCESLTEPTMYLRKSYRNAHKKDCPDGECQLRQPTTDELYKFIMKATKEEHQLRGDWDSNHEEIGADSDRFIREIQAGEVQSLTDGRGLVAYGLDSGKMIIYDLYVLPEYRNAGVGGTLLDKVTEMAGGRPVALTVNSMNAPAIQLYRNHGFRKVGTVSYNGVELLRMERKLDET